MFQDYLKVLFLSCAAVTLFSSSCNAQDRIFKGQINLAIHGEQYKITDLPRFEDFPAEPPAKEIAKDIDFSSIKGAWNFRTRLRDGLKQGANFNGHYAVITHGCGSPCQINWIVDVNDGRVLGSFSSSLGAEYRIDSALIASNLASDEQLSAEVEVEALYIENIEFLAIKDGKIISIKDLKIYEEIENLKSSRK